MTEGLGKKYLLEYKISSAGTNPEIVNPFSIKVMQEIGIDISKNQSKKINNEQLNKFDLLITLCGNAKDTCPIINTDKHIHWNIVDPAKFKGSKKEITLKFSETRNIIFNHIKLLKDKLNKY